MPKLTPATESERETFGAGEPGGEVLISKKSVSPLRFLLMQTDLEHLLHFLHQMGVSYTLTRTRDLHYRVSLYRDGMLTYTAESSKGPKPPLCDALANFLIHEQRDFHEYQGPARRIELGTRCRQALGLEPEPEVPSAGE